MRTKAIRIIATGVIALSTSVASWAAMTSANVTAAPHSYSMHQAADTPGDCPDGLSAPSGCTWG
jgi:hypothetical protein